MVKRMKKVFSLNTAVNRNVFQHFAFQLIKYDILKIWTRRAILTEIKLSKSYSVVFRICLKSIGHQQDKLYYLAPNLASMNQYGSWRGGNIRLLKELEIHNVWFLIRDLLLSSTVFLRYFHFSQDSIAGQF